MHEKTSRLNNDPQPAPFSLKLYSTNQDKSNTKNTFKTTIKDDLLKFGRKQWWFWKETKNLVKTEQNNWSNELVSNAPAFSWQLFGPVTPMNAPIVWWYDFVEVSRKIRNLLWTFWCFLLPMTKKSQLFFKTTIKKQSTKSPLRKWSDSIERRG